MLQGLEDANLALVAVLAGNVCVVQSIVSTVRLRLSVIVVDLVLRAFSNGFTAENTLGLTSVGCLVFF